MPDVSTLVILGAGWTLLLVSVWALCVAAARGDGQEDHEEQPAERPTIVADTGAIRALLQGALEPLDADQLTVTVRIDEREAVLASARPVVEALPGRWLDQTVPVRVGGRSVARLRALRRPGRARFGAEETLALQEVATGVAASMQAAHSSGSVPVDETSAMA